MIALLVALFALMGWTPGSGSGSAAAADIITAAQGFLSQNLDRQNTTGATLATGGLATGMLVYLKAGQVVNNVYMGCTVAASGLTTNFVGIYSSNGQTLYAQSTNQTTLFAASGLQAIPLSAPWTVPATGVYLVVFVAAGTTLPTLIRGNGGSTSAPAQLGANPASFQNVGSGLVALPATPLVFSPSGTFAWWVGLA